MNKTRSYCLLILLSALLLACSREEEKPRPIASRRTVLAFLAGDNNLSGEVDSKIAALLAGWKPEMGSLLIYADKSGSGFRPVLLQATVRKNKTAADTIKQYVSDNSASSEQWREVLKDMQHFAPSRHYGLILFSHATGWLPQGASHDPLNYKQEGRVRSLFEDDRREMPLQDFADVIPDGMFDFIAADMCFMAGVEVAYALRRKTPYLLVAATEIVSPGFTPIYPEHLHRFYKPQLCLTGFAKAYMEQAGKQEGVYRSATISVITTAETEPLALLARELIRELSAEEIDRLQYFDRNDSFHLFFDLGDWLHTLAQTEQQHTHIDQLLSRAVYFKQHTERFLDIDIKKHSGLSVYVPQAPLLKLNAAHRSTEWGQAVYGSTKIQNPHSRPQAH